MTGPQVETTPQTLSPMRLDGPAAGAQAHPAEYYNLIDTTGRPLAGLLVLFDRKGEPVRAEAQLYDTTEGSARELALRQAQALLRSRYYSRRPLPMYITRLYTDQPHIQVTLEGPPPPSAMPGWVRPLALGVLIALIFTLVGWFARGALTSPPPAEVAAPSAPVISSPAGGTGEPSVTPVAESAGATPAPERIVETNDLPPSRNALPLEVGQRVRVCDGCTVYVRSQPGANEGDILGYLESGDEVEILNGPVWRQGESDTIVWWYVRRLSDGLEGWTPANTSQMTLLFPVE